jgi:hypothetical protein
VVPYVVINTGMLPHQFSAFTEGLFGPLHAEFERTPKAATITIASPTSTSTSTATATSAAVGRPQRRQPVKVHRPYIAAEVFFVSFQVAWAVVFLRDGFWFGAAGSVALAACVVGLAYFYGDHLGRRMFVVETRSPRRGRSRGS